jgi:hypothetical protein
MSNDRKELYDKILSGIGVIGIVVLETINLLKTNYDGNLLSLSIGAIVYLITRRYYKMRMV